MHRSMHTLLSSIDRLIISSTTSRWFLAKDLILSRGEAGACRNMINLGALGCKANLKLELKILRTLLGIDNVDRLSHQLVVAGGDRDGCGGWWFHFHRHVLGNGALEIESIDRGICGVFESSNQSGILLVPNLRLCAFEFNG